MYDGIYRLFDRPAHRVSDLVGTGIVALLLFSSSRLPGTDEIFQLPWSFNVSGTV